jgi:DNA-binding Lrp family transcriptional regulator
MPENLEILTTDLLRKLKKLEESDILVGIPCYNSARTIGHVVREAKK